MGAGVGRAEVVVVVVRKLGGGFKFKIFSRVEQFNARRSDILKTHICCGPWKRGD